MKVVVFSGGCVSGKTTMMELVQKNLEAKCVKCSIMSELMRDENIFSIDDIRSNPSKYLALQERIILEKINLERNVKFSSASFNTDVVLIDRAVSDSLFYLLFYTDKNKLTLSELQRFNILYAAVEDHAKYIFDRVYDMVLFFKPLDNVEVKDSYRPEKVNVLKYIESRMIEMLNHSFCMQGSRMATIDLNKDSNDKTLSRLTQMIWDLL